MRMLQSTDFLILGYVGPGKYDKKTQKKNTYLKLEKKIQFCTTNSEINVLKCGSYIDQL